MNENEIQLLNQLAATQSEQAFYQNATSNPLLVKKVLKGKNMILEKQNIDLKNKLKRLKKRK